MAFKRHLLSLTAAGSLALGAGAVIAPLHAFAGPPGAVSATCDDGQNGNMEFPILSSPAELAFEIGSNGNLASGHFALCYSTTQENTSAPETAGGVVFVDAPGNGYPGSDTLGCISDPSTPVAVNCSFSTTPTVSESGSNLTLTIPFSVCAGVGTCPTLSNPGNAPYTTGAIIGTISQQSCGTNPSCTSAAYTLSALCVQVDGIDVTRCDADTFLGGVTTTGSSPVNVGPLGGCGALICTPSYLGTSGSQLATIYVPGTTITEPIYGEGVCVLRSGSQPNPDPCTQ